MCLMKKLILSLLISALATYVIYRLTMQYDREILSPHLTLHLAPDNDLVVPLHRHDSFHFSIYNCEEQIDIKEIQYRNDSIFFKMPVFGTEFKGLMSGKRIVGQWYNYLKGDDYTVHFEIRLDTQKVKKTSWATDFSGIYRCTFTDKDGNETAARALFSQDSMNNICGTFQTETGDYRYLSGKAKADFMEISTFDGSHAFWFWAGKKEDGTLVGKFRSGNHWFETWTAEKDSTFSLSDMKSLTYLLPGFNRFDFKMPNLVGDSISLNDTLYQNKVVIVQILGTWCPNCMDESRYLKTLYQKYNEHGLEIVGLDFEPDSSFNYYAKRIERFKRDLDIPYPILKAGLSNKTEARKALPMLNKIISYPTAIILDRKGDIVEIHTGFSGPGTGDAYKKYCKETESLIETLLK